MQNGIIIKTARPRVFDYIYGTGNNQRNTHGLTNQNCMLDILILRKEEPEIPIPLCCVKICSFQLSLCTRVIECPELPPPPKLPHLLFLSDQTVFDSSNASEGVSLLGQTTIASTKESLRHDRTNIAHCPNNCESERCGVDIA